MRKNVLKTIKFTKLDRIFPSEKYKKYLEEFGVTDEEKLDVKNIEQIFLVLRSDFIKGKLDLDEFALICNSLWNTMTKKHFDDDNTSLATVMDKVNELSFNIRTNIAKTLEAIPHKLQSIYDYEPESDSILQGSSVSTENINHQARY